jgi:hypothetical protein
MEFEFLTHTSPKEVTLDRLNAFSNRCRNRHQGEEISREIGQSTFNKSNPTSLRKIRPLPTGKSSHRLFHHPIPTRLVFETSPQRHTQVSNRQRTNLAAQSLRQLTNITHLANQHQNRFSQIDLEPRNYLKADKQITNGLRLRPRSPRKYQGVIIVISTISKITKKISLKKKNVPS